MQVKYWGVRGSLPSAPTPQERVYEVEKLLTTFARAGKGERDVKAFLAEQGVPLVGGYGTATTCAEVNAVGTQIIIDGGSGIRNLGQEMMKGAAGKGQAEIHIFLTHFHWDHLLGLPFFAPLFIKGNKVHFYAVQPELEEMIRIKFRRPLFPVAFEQLQSTIQFHQLAPRRTFHLNELEVTPYLLDHPDPCWGFRVEALGKSYAHCVDTEGTRTSREALGEDLPLYLNADLMYFDAQYTLPELVEKANWGHSAAQLGLDLAFDKKIKRVVFAHHDPGAGIDQVHALHEQTVEYFRWKQQTAANNNIVLPEVKWEFAFEGLTIDL